MTSESACLYEISAIPFFSLSGQVKLSGSSCRVSAPQGKDYFIMKPTHMLVLLLLWQPNGWAPKGARSLKVREVWETLGGMRKKKRECVQSPLNVLHKRKANLEWWGKLLEIKGRCAWACSVVVRKHLTHREKRQNYQAHAQLKS